MALEQQVDLRALVEREAAEAGRALAALTDESVTAALERAAALVHERRAEILLANEADCAAAEGKLDEGMLDRLRLDERRVDALAAQAQAMAALPPLEREVGTRTLENGLVVSERRIPIGTVGANFEARPNVALDVAGQLLKSLNTAVLRTGGAALRTVTVLVDDVLRPALEDAGLPGGAVGLVRSPDREGARVLVSLPKVLPLVILRGSGETTAQLSRLAAEHGVRALAHAEGGGVLYVHPAASREKTLAHRGGEPRPARRLQPAQPAARRPRRARAPARPARAARPARDRGAGHGTSRRGRPTARRPPRPRVGERRRIGSRR